MGASFEYEKYGKQTKDEVKKQFNSDVEDHQYMNGHSYSGGIGMLGGIGTWLEKTFNTETEAANYICDKHQKWDAAMAAQLTDGSWVIGGWCSS